MHNEFTAIVEHEDPWYVVYCAEVRSTRGDENLWPFGGVDLLACPTRA